MLRGFDLRRGLLISRKKAQGELIRLAFALVVMMVAYWMMNHFVRGLKQGRGLSSELESLILPTLPERVIKIERYW